MCYFNLYKPNACLFRTQEFVLGRFGLHKFYIRQLNVVISIFYISLLTRKTNLVPDNSKTGLIRTKIVGPIRLCYNKDRIYIYMEITKRRRCCRTCIWSYCHVLVKKICSNYHILHWLGYTNLNTSFFYCYL
jgi:hypothetical protein